MDLNDLRNDYGLACLNEADLDPDPIRQFQAWLAEAIGCGEPEPNGTALATAGIDGQPSVRMVLLRGLDERGFSFYTNYESRKAQELAVNPRAALLFFWPRLERQVRVEGRVERVSAEESDHYFASRPRGARIGAWASPQSERIADRAALEARVQAVDQRYPPGEEIPRPPFWGGYRVIPVRIEFWQGGLDRLHDRLRYCREEGGAWRIERLGP